MPILLLILLLVITTSAQAESYIAGQVGVNIPAAFRNIEIEDPLLPPGTTMSDLSLDTNVVYGAKIGHYFDRADFNWLGVEVEAFNATPHAKSQSVAMTVPGVGTVPFTTAGSTVRITTLAFNVLVRYPGELFQPYLGAGLGIFFVNATTVGESQSTTAPGANVLAGLRAKVTAHWSVFGEYKFNYAHLSFDPTPNVLGFSGDYTAHNAVFGIGYHF